MIKRLIIVLLALGLVFGGIFGWKYHKARQQAAQSSQPPPPATVASTRARSDTWQPYLHTVGSLMASQGVFVSNEIAGLVEAIHFDSGQKVAKGDLLLNLDDSVDQAELQGLIAERRLAEIRFERAARLLKENSVSKSDYDEAQGRLQETRALVESKQQTLAKKAIRAPFSGILGIRQVDLGQYLSPGAQIVSLQHLDPIYVDFTLPEHNLSTIATGQEVVVDVQAYPDRPFHGRVSAIEPRINVGTRNIKVRATLDNEGQILRPGMFTEVRVVLPEQRNVLTLPRTAITYNPYGDTVFRIEQQNGELVVQRQQVQTGETRGGRVEIIDGLQEGDRVVSAGQVKLRNGQHVVIDNSVSLDEQIPSP